MANIQTFQGAYTRSVDQLCPKIATKANSGQWVGTGTTRVGFDASVIGKSECGLAVVAMSVVRVIGAVRYKIVGDTCAHQ